MRPTLLTLLAVTILVSCGKDKDEDPTPENALIGTWTGVSQQSKVMSGNKTFAQALLDAIPDADQNWANQSEDIVIGINDMSHTVYNTEIVFQNEGVWSLEDGSSAIGKWTLSSDQKTIKMTLDNSTLKKMDGTIKKLTATELVIEVKVEDSMDYLFAVVDYQYTSTLTFSKKS